MNTKQSKLNIGGLVYRLIAWIFALIFFYPIYFTIISAFKDNNEIWNTMFALPSVWNLSNFTDAFRNIQIHKAIANSIIFSTGATVVIIIVVTMASYVIARNILKISSALRIYYLLGLMIPAYCMLIPIVQMFTDLNMRDSYISMILLYAGINFPMSSFLITGYIKGINREIDESAYIDGCSMFTTIFKIIMPIAIPGISTAAIISFLTVYNELIFSTTLLSKKSMHTISVALLHMKGERFTSLGPMFAAIVLSILPMMVIYILFQERVEKGLAAGAVKG
ncbi:MAG: carbohydrate ABC transporter permease [Acetivibrionales bacterium]